MPHVSQVLIVGEEFFYKSICIFNNLKALFCCDVIHDLLNLIEIFELNIMLSAFKEIIVPTVLIGFFLQANRIAI